MSETAASLRHKIASAGELEAVVRTMKAMAAASIGQYENAVRSLDEYYRTVQLGLVACFRQGEPWGAVMPAAQKESGAIGAVVFGSDQGLVGQFNEVMAEFVVNTLGNLPGKKTVWTVGERIQSRLADTDLMPGASFILPNSINAITSLVGQILVEMETQREKGEIAQVYLFHNRPQSGAIYIPVSQRLLPLDDVWRRDLASLRWPTGNLPEVMNGVERTLLALVREYLFVSLFRACAESLASENASRLAAMQRAEKNIDELLEDLNRTFHRLRQSGIDEELFDVVSGFEALTGPK
ncbi:F0F1 ATP synthase subunit gamma [Sulfuriferula sp.]|uniref:F0F1 ATP synthase subunit gamma n=1 Tax=Sulfuriferula sp. TaxID=2025307 RepID=UPI00272F6328|nr:F0F1 ATP synthase subunit gamma [Sulfuriferula sp.]MDP2027795.1 F0F1 ATP synthase subunit gamma [Sulfuriferula sp.]